MSKQVVIRTDSDLSWNIQMTASDVVEEYYHMMKNMLESAARETEKEIFDGNLLEKDGITKEDCAQKIGIQPVSQALIEYLVLVEWYLDRQRYPQLYETAIYNAILRLEKALSKTSDWEIFDPECDDLQRLQEDVTDFELNIMEQIVSCYIDEVLCKQQEQTLFFPLSDLPEPTTLVRWRILEKLAVVKVVPYETAYLQKLKLSMKTRLTVEIERWLQQLFQDIKFGVKSKILEDVKQLTKVLQEAHLVLQKSVEDFSLLHSLFDKTFCNYWDIMAEVLEDQLYELCKDAMKLMDGYQTTHKDFHINMKDSCVLCYGFYVQLQQLVQLLGDHVKTEASIGKLRNFGCLFSESFFHLLHVLQVECHSRIARAVQTEDRDTIVEEKWIYSSTVIVLNCLITVLDEWNRLKLEDDDMQLAFLIKVTDIVCDGAKIFGESLENRADALNSHYKEPDFIKKICALGNSVEHILSFMMELPLKMNWKKVLNDSSDVDPSSSVYKKQILRVLELILQSMSTDLQSTTQAIHKLAILRIRNLCERYLNSWLEDHIIPKPAYQNVERFLAFLHDQLDIIHDFLQENTFQWFLRELWASFLECIKNGFQEGKHPDYARAIKKNIEEMHKYFNGLQLDIVEEHQLFYEQIHQILMLNSKSTVELELNYYRQLADVLTSPKEYFGHIAFQAGYKQTGRGTVDVHVKVQKMQRLPLRKFQLDAIWAKIELCPKVIFPSFRPLKTRTVTVQLENPVLNESFLFPSLPVSVLNIEGAVIQIHVINQDSSYCTEALLRLNQVPNMSGLTSIDFLPVYLIALRCPGDSQPSPFRVLEKRKKKDNHAKRFVSSRQLIRSNPNHLLSCIRGATTLRQLFFPRQNARLLQSKE